MAPGCCSNPTDKCSTDKKECGEEAVAKQLALKLKEMPLPDKLRALGLRNIIEQQKKLDEQMEAEMKAIEEKYDALNTPLFKRTNDIVCGKVNPEASELTTATDVLETAEVEGLEASLADLGNTPLTDYWVKVFKNCECLGDEIKEGDEPIFKHLQQVEFVKGKEEDNETWTFTFTFSQNEFFTNEVLTKKMVMADDEQCEKSEGTEIEWKEGQNVTVKQIKKKQKNKKSGQQRTVTKEVEQESFFNFFKTRDFTEEAMAELEDEEAEELENKMVVDIDIASMIKDEAIPYGLEYYLGLKFDNPEDMEGMEGLDDEDDDDDEEEDMGGKNKKKQQKKNKKADGQNPEEKPECKQQ